VNHDLRQPDPDGTLWGFTPPPVTPPAPHNGTPTSRAAAARVEVHAPTLRERVYRAVEAAGRRGLTRQEIADGEGIKLQTVCGRVSELLDPDLAQLFATRETRNGGSVLITRRVAIEHRLLDPRNEPAATPRHQEPRQ
jgi:hypothetical protein